MSSGLEIVVAIVAVLTFAASAVSAYVSLKTRAALAELELRMVERLAREYVRKEDLSPQLWKGAKTAHA